MKKVLFSLMAMLVFYGVSLAQTHVMQDNGRTGTTYTVWVATNIYNVIDPNYSGAYSCYTLKAKAGKFWFDYDTSVSTWASSGLTYKINGITGENASIVENEEFTSNGVQSSGLWIISDSLTKGCTVQVIIQRIY